MRADLTYCDFLILAPLSLEISALEAQFKRDGWNLAEHDTRGEFQYLVEATILDPDVAYFQRRVVIAQLMHQGILNACVETARILEMYEPGYVISFGIAGTLNPEDAPIGAVVFAISLFYYEPSKERAGETQSRMDPIRLGDNLLNPFRNLRFTNVVTVDGPVASGEKLMSDVGSANRKRIMSANGKMLCVEMEAAGVGRAVNRLCPTSEFVVIKGISDAADREKNLAAKDIQTRDRTLAAENAAACTAELARRAPLRRAFRSIPRPADEAMAKTALDEASQISAALKPYGIKANDTELFLCLFGRRSPIPAYYHWRQYASALHWIDFKILTALKALPREIVTPTPLVTLAAPDVSRGQRWDTSVTQLLGVDATTSFEIKQQHEELSRYFNRVGLTFSAEAEIRQELQEFQAPGRPEITLNLIRYMLDQFCHRRMFVFTWEESGAKWMKSLARTFGIWFSLLKWETMYLSQRDGKQGLLGKTLIIEPGSYTSLRERLTAKSEPGVIQEFVNHFKCHLDIVCGEPSAISQRDPREQLESLMEYWDRVFFGLSQTHSERETPKNPN